MSIRSSGINTSEAYTWYREGKLLVNRRYQRKLVWTVAEKQKLIDSILLGYPLPLILLAERTNSRYEIIDGMQRLNAIFSFIETSYPTEDNKYFDLQEFLTAKLERDKGTFEAQKNPQGTLSREDCAKILNYQLAVTTFPAEDTTKINEVFSRINSTGKKLSAQEQRQAGVVSGFSDLVRETASEIRGDTSYNELELYKMPVISIDTRKEAHGYKINAEQTFWCHHGILDTKKLRQSEDEEMIADFSASILSSPSVFAKSKDKLDHLYSDTESAQNIERKLKQYGMEKLKKEIKDLLFLIDDTVKKCHKKSLALRKIVMGPVGTPSIKTPFYALFMAFYQLVVKESKYPENAKKILKALEGVHKALKMQTKNITSAERQKNIDKIKGLIQDHFVKKEPDQISHGPGLARDLENSFRRSKIETPHYEFKQGFLKLDAGRKFDKGLVEKLAQTACGMANLSPDRESYIHIGVADRKEHADKIKQLDGITPKKINGVQVVGVDREAKLQKKTLEKYVDFFVSEFKKTELSEPLKRSILKNMDTIKYHGLSVIRLKVEPQTKVSYVDNQCFIRENNHTKRVNGPVLEEIINLFNKASAKKS